MIPFFPDPRPDELLYSVCARLQDMMRFDHLFAIGQHLFGTRYPKARIDLPSRLAYLVDALPPGNSYTVDRLIDECTLLPFYTPFLLPDHVFRIRVAMASRENKTSNWLGAVMGRHILSGTLRFCPHCVETERSKFGDCYWHRLHQIRCVQICPVHFVMLESSTVPMRDTIGPSTLISAERAIQVIPPARTLATEPVHPQLVRLAEDVAWLLQQPNLFVGPDALSRRYRSVLIEKDLAASTGSIYWSKICTAFEKHYSPALLTLIQCPLDEQAIIERFRRAASTEPYSRNPIYHLLLIQFLGYSCEVFFAHDPEKKAFGEGPWPCLNPACNQFKHSVIQHSDVIIRPHEGSRVMGIFACACGFVYARVGPDQSPDDRFRRTRILSYGSVWEAKLRQLSEDPSISLSEASRRLGVAIRAIKSNIARLELEFVTQQGVWTQSNVEKQDKRMKKEQQYLHLREKHRAAWLSSKQEYPSATLEELRGTANASYCWLRRNDKEWFLAHSPKRQWRTSFRKPEYWKQRDEQLARDVKIYAEELLNLPGRPVRITESKILIHLGPLVKQMKYKQKVPLVVQALSEVTETFEAYLIRKIWWVAEQYREAQQLPSPYQLQRKTCVSYNALTPAVRSAIESACEMLRQTGTM